jgi:large repetitive protein
LISKTLTIKILKSLSITTITLPLGEPGLAYKTTTLKSVGGASQKTWSIVDGDLPSGLEISPKGVIKGKPALDSSDNYTFTVQVSDDIGTAIQDYKLTIYDPLAINALPDGTSGTTYSQVLSELTTGGSGGYKYTITAKELKKLPPGLKFTSKTGTISGTPTTPGEYQFEVKVTDSLKGTLTRTVTIVIN